MIIHYVMGDNPNTRWMVDKLVDSEGTVAVIDPKFRGLTMKGGVTYSNIEYIQSTIDLPVKHYFHAYVSKRNQQQEQDSE